MGMTIDESLENLKTLQADYQQFYDDVWQDPESLGIMAESLQVAIDTMSKYQQLQAAYEARLNADMVAMLTEIQLEMEEYEPKWVENDEQAVASCRTWEDLDGLIQQKINDLVGKDGNIREERQREG